MRSTFSVVVIVVVLTVCSAIGQSTFGSIVGVVHDTTQAVVPGASVNDTAFGRQQHSLHYIGPERIV